jgi:ring-1,2-phenylacetyl-CoA epoxidase subunit PaaE
MNLLITLNVFNRELIMTTFYPLTIKEIQHETNDAVVLTFSIPASLAAEFKFKPGQYLTLKSTLDNEELRRCYSICSSANDSDLSIGIKEIPDGRFSQYANQELKVGDSIDVMSPKGQFGFEPEKNTNKKYLGIAVGSGITPILSMLKSTLEAEPESQFTLLYGNKTLNSTMFKRELSDYKNRFTDRLQLVYLFSRESHEAELLNGRLDAQKLEDLGHSFFDWSKFNECYLCGPEEMLEPSYSVLNKGGIRKENFHVERFNISKSPRRTIESHVEKSDITVKRDGRIMSIEMTEDDDSILDAALRQGADLPHACKGGVCATCMCKVTSGAVEMSVNYSLEEDQVNKGYVLSCQAVPTSNEVTVDFDA